MVGKTVVRFHYSYPYERTLARLGKIKLGRNHDRIAKEKELQVQKIWAKYEKEVLKLFEKIYKIKIEEKHIIAWLSLIVPGSYSDPLTISLKRIPDIEDNPRSQRRVVYLTTHELAHYFAYTRSRETFFNKLFDKIRKKDLLGERGANLHYLIQAVEFGIIGEVFGKEYAQDSRNWVIEKWKDNEYGESAKLLSEHNVPVDKTCLEYIERKILTDLPIKS